MTVFSAAVLLLLVMDPMGNIPVFLTALKNVDPRRRRTIIIRELFIALAVLVFFLFAGSFLLDVLHISQPSLTVAGGIILFLIAVRMIFPSEKGTHEHVDGEPFIVPLAVPYVAGPSAMATVMLIMSGDQERWPEWLLALAIAWAVTGSVLFLSAGLSRFLGKKGLVAVERLMGMILTAIAVQMFLTGIEEFLRS